MGLASSNGILLRPRSSGRTSPGHTLDLEAGFTTEKTQPNKSSGSPRPVFNLTVELKTTLTHLLSRLKASTGAATSRSSNPDIPTPNECAWATRPDEAQEFMKGLDPYDMRSMSRKAMFVHNSL